MDILHDSIWQFWGAIFTALSTVIAVIIYLLQRNKKRLVYYLLTESPLLSVDDKVKGSITITYENTQIQNIYLVLLKIENNGNVDIAVSDYEQPTIFSFTNSAFCLSEALS